MNKFNFEMMKHKTLFIILVFSQLFFISCETRTYEEITAKQEIQSVVKYNTTIKPILEQNCVTCHSTNGSASYYPLTNYSESKAAIDAIIDRIKRPNGDPEIMPKGGQISASTINLIEKWKFDGLLE